ncbi:MAG: PHB depolymerase family esterase [Pseudomonadota bacterium]
MNVALQHFGGFSYEGRALAPLWWYMVFRFPTLPTTSTLVRRTNRLVRIARQTAGLAWSFSALPRLPASARKKPRAVPARKPRHPPPAARAALAGTPGCFTAGTFSYRRAEHGYKLYLPPAVAGVGPPMLVVMLHGCGQDPDDFAAGTRMNRLAARDNVAVLYPAQSAAANRQRCWNWFAPINQQRGRGETAWIAALARAVARGLAVPARQVFVCGLSAGGAMAALLARLYPEQFAACGVHSGVAAGTALGAIGALGALRSGRRLAAPPAGRHVPTIAFHGDADNRVHPRHSEHVVDAALDALLPRGGRPARNDSGAIVRHGTSAQGGAYTQHIYVNGRGQVLAERWQLHGAGHAWSGGSRRGSFTDPAGPDASGEMLRFFRQCSPATQAARSAPATPP